MEALPSFAQRKADRLLGHKMSLAVPREEVDPMSHRVPHGVPAEQGQQSTLPAPLETVNAWVEADSEPGFRERLRAASERMDRGEFVEYTPTRHRR